VITYPAPAPIVYKSTAPTTTEKAALALLSFVDIVQTDKFLHRTWPKGWIPAYEQDPLLGRHPSFGRMALTGIAMDELILHVKSPLIRRLSIGIEAGNVGHNFSIGMHL
jgi:hypothetical protein